MEKYRRHEQTTNTQIKIIIRCFSAFVRVRVRSFSLYLFVLVKNKSDILKYYSEEDSFGFATGWLRWIARICCQAWLE